jgi:hypothetical protein
MFYSSVLHVDGSFVVCPPTIGLSLDSVELAKKAAIKGQIERSWGGPLSSQ